ncbi:MAG: glycosyltransferase, partial [Lachnospiraceae bacterium]|nr:glycosyltransferase [Lachnospiraceae bacterium]
GKALQNLIAGAAFSLYPSEWYENCPFSVMETQLYGTPMIASNLGGTPELLQDGVAGELFEAGNAKLLQEKITKLWMQPELCRKYQENCKDIKFDTIEEYCDKIVRKVYTMRSI